MILYDIGFIIVSVFLLPVLFIKGKLHKGYLDRLGRFPKERCSESIWVHAVSVGEVLCAGKLLDLIRAEYPQTRIVFTTITKTGNDVAKSILKPGDILTYLPLDVSFLINKFLFSFRPKVLVCLETEIWPNLFYRLYRNNVPVIIVNGRISDKSFKKYFYFRGLLRPTLRKVGMFLMQSDEYAQRIASMGADKDKVLVTGTMKFDMPKQNINDPGVRDRLKLKPGQILLVAGCTHVNEEEILIESFLSLTQRYPFLRLLIAPRHIERAKSVRDIVLKYKLKAILISQGDTDEEAVFILDKLGELKNYYAASDISFVGGSLVRAGGHNILEPAAFSKPVIFGNYMNNFSQIRQIFLKQQAALEVSSRQELTESIARLIDDPVLGRELGERARNIVESNQGAALRNFEVIKKVLDK